jgi:hypothetical protein
VGDGGESRTGSLNCADVKELFPDFLTGRLSPFQSVLFEEHRAACASCRSELAAGARGTLQGHLTWIPAHRLRVTGRIGARLRRRLFHPARIKLPLEAAGLVIVAGLAFYVVHHSSPQVAVEKRSVAALEQQTVGVGDTETLRSEPVAEPLVDRPSIVESKPSDRPAVKPQAAPARPAVPPMQRPPALGGNTVSGAEAFEAQPTDERATSAQRGADIEANSARESPAAETATDFPAKDTAAESDPAGVTVDPRISPDDLPYFFL